MSIFDLIIKGGLLMIPISLCSVFSLGIIVERVIHYRKAKGNVNKLREKLEPLIIGNKVGEGRLLCEESGGTISNIFRVALQELQKEPDMTQPVEDEIEVTRRVIDEELQVSVLPTLMIANSNDEIVFIHQGYRPGDEKIIREKIITLLYEFESNEKE